MSVGAAADLWSQYKDTLAVIEAALVEKQPGIRLKFEDILATRRGLFEKVLENPPPTTADAELIKKATSEGFLVPGAESPTQLAQCFVEEAIIITNLFGLNQVSSLQLLLHGEENLPHYPGLTRGLVAVTLYYDSRASIVRALRTLMTSRPGLSWSVDIPEDLTQVLTTFTSQLVNTGLVTTILSQLTRLDWTRDLGQLQKNAALGDAHHVSSLRRLHGETRQELADSLYGYAAQSGLPTTATVKLLDYLASVTPSDNGSFDEVTIALVMAALQALDFNGTGAESGCELPIISDSTFIPTISRELDGRGREWECPGLLALLQFCWSMSLSGLRVGGILPQDCCQQLEEDETFMDLALDGKVFHFLPDLLITASAFNKIEFDKQRRLLTLVSSTFHKEEFYRRRLHTLITDCLSLMPLKIKDLRNRADDAARNKMMHEQEGIQYSVPVAGQHFQQLLLSVASLYSGDSLELGLSVAYWCAAETGVSGDIRHCSSKQIALYKFVRLAGDLLMPSLFVPYVTMLAGLADSPTSAAYCFNLLKVNCNGSSNISLDHFFASLQQYYNNLKQESPMLPEYTIYRTKPMTRGISPQEAEGLVAVMELLTTLARRSEAARLCMLEQPSWSVLNTLVGLMACTVPTYIKSRLVYFLAALARSPENVHSIWQHIEMQQLVGGQGGKPGLTEELEEIESRAEEFPLTRAFLELLDRLTDAEMPGNLGAGSRMPGLLPYLNYVQDSVFLKFSTRTYKDPAERWEVASLCLSLLHKILEEYEPTQTDFQGPNNSSGLHPGFYILMHLHQSSLFLRTVLFVLDECRSFLDTFSPFQGKKNVESACNPALCLLHTALRLSGDFIAASRNASASLVLTPLSKLLLGVNPRSGRPDHLLNISRYVMYGYWMPAARFNAVKILNYVASSTSNQMDLLATFTFNNAVANAVLKAFTDALDADEEDESAPPGSTSKESTPCRLAIVELMQTGLGMAAPTLAHFLLGFDVRRGVSKSHLENPAIAGIRTPLHAILGLVNPEGAGVPAKMVSSCPHLATALFRLIYTLVSAPDTSEPTLRFLRSNGDFMPRQLACLTTMLELEGVNSLRSVAWILRTTAVELRILMKTRQSSHLNKILSLLLDSKENFEESLASEVSQFYDDTTFTQLSRTMIQTQSRQQISAPLANHRLATILSFINFETEIVASPNWELFDDGQVSDLLQQCQVENPEGEVHERLIMVPRLHKFLAAELVNLQGSSANNQRTMIQSEIQSILVYAVHWNSVQENAAARRDLLDSWRQVTEVLLLAAPAEHLPPVSKQQILLQLLQTLLNKVSTEDAVPGLAILVSSAVLLLVTSLRATYEGAPDKKTVLGETFVRILDASALEANKSGEVFSSSLQVILKGLVNWIHSVGAGSQLIRTNLYAALVAYLRIGKTSRAESSRSLEISERGKLQRINMEVIQSVGTGLLEVLARDAVSGHEVRRMLAFAVLDELIFMDRNGYVTRFLAEQGFVKHIIESLIKDDPTLVRLVTKAEGNIRDLYVYEAKVGLMARIATTTFGAELLLQAGLMARLAELSVLDLRPDADAILLRQEDVDGVMTMYQNIFFPILRLVQSILSTLGGSNRCAGDQTVRFLAGHDDVFSQILRGSTARSSLNSALLQELSLVTAIVSRAAIIDIRADASDAAGFELAGILSRVQKQMISLMSQFQLSPELLTSLEENRPGALITPSSMTGAAPANLLLVLKILNNVTSYARSVVTTSGNNSKTCRLVVSPNLMDTRESCSGSLIGGHHTSVGRPASLGLLVLSLKYLATHLKKGQASLNELKEKEKGLSACPSSELASLAQIDPARKLPGVTVRRLAAAKLESIIAEKQLVVQLSSETLESMGFLLWRHLEHYLLFSSAAVNSAPSTPYQATVRRLNESRDQLGEIKINSPRSNFPKVDLDKLKEDVKVVLNDSFFEGLGEVIGIVEKRSSSATSSAGFLQAIIRRSKRLAQLHT